MWLSKSLLAAAVLAINLVTPPSADPSQYLTVNELKPPGFMPGSTTSSSLDQASYAQQILSPSARVQLDQFSKTFDKFSETLGEWKFGRAKFVTPPKFDNITCCYPDFDPSLEITLADKASADLSTRAVLTEH